jgi:hypothetical protein
LWETLVYLKHNPPLRKLANEQKLKAHGRLLSRLRTRVEFLASRMNELSAAFNDRFSAANRLPHVYDQLTTLCLDTMPIKIRRSY